MNILVTGGAGYIGSHVVRELLAAGHLPVTYDNLSEGHREAVAGGVFVEGDLRDGARLLAAMRDRGVEAVMHLAASCSVGESVADPHKYYDNNVAAGLGLLAAMRGAGVRLLVFSSSAAVYGEPREVPITEAHPLAPINPYGRTKAILEELLGDFARADGLRHVSLRYFNAAGAAPDGLTGESHDPETHLVAVVLNAALSGGTVDVFGTDYPTPDGTCLRDYIHVVDLAQAHLLALEGLGRGTAGGAYNLGNGGGYSVREVIETARRVTGREVRVREAPRRAGDPAVLVAGADRIRRELGWAPRIPGLEEIVETAWRWHKNRRY